ncbi:MAG: beta-xylosidase [Arthrospira sp. PLM2.Bin9]|nr:beta-xylosidase [Arthrospira sp. PLM2.Bin9]TVU53479.1 MAG: beta-xylosidase [Arthrospira sp. PLM2.Bin9]
MIKQLAISRRSVRIKWLSVLLAIAGALLFVGVSIIPAIAITQGDLTIDFATSQPGVKSMSGFLYGVEEDEPPDHLIQPLQPKLWRTSRLNLYPRLTGFGATFQLLLSDTWGYGRPRGWPYDDYTRWENHVRNLAREHKGKKMLWDIWNEPDLRDPFWHGTREQFFETYKRAYRVLREELGPDVIIGGPSITKYDKGFLTAFLNYCRDNNLEVNSLSWHELNDQTINAIASHIRDANQSFRRNPAYRSLKIQRLDVNEIIGPTAQYRPAENLAYLYYTEQGGASAAAKACWEPKAGGRNNCFNKSLDGLVQPGPFAPRAVWWVYKAYADGFETRVRTQGNNPRVIGLASRSNGGNQAQVLFGYFEQGRSPGQATVTLTLRNLQQLGFLQPGQPLNLTISRIPDTGEAVVKDLAIVKREQITVTNQIVRLTIPNIRLHEAYILTIG